MQVLSGTTVCRYGLSLLEIKVSFSFGKPPVLEHYYFHLSRNICLRRDEVNIYVALKRNTFSHARSLGCILTPRNKTPFHICLLGRSNKQIQLKGSKNQIMTLTIIML